MARKYGLQQRRSGNWDYDFYVRRKRYRGSTQTKDYELAEQLAHKIYTDIFLDRHDIKKIVVETNIDDFITRHILALQADSSPHWAYSAEHQLREFSTWLEEKHGIKNLSGITVEVLENYKTYQLGCVKKVTVKNKLKVVNTLLNRAVRYGILKENPMKKVTPVNGIQVNRVRFFSKEEIDKIFNAFESPDFKRFAYLRDFVNIALKSGMRRGALVNLEWKDVDIDQRKIYIRNKAKFTTKSYRERIVPLHASLLPYFEENRDREGYVFIHQKKRFNPKTTTKNFGLMLEKLGIKVNGGDGIHTLRHTFASWLIMSGVSLRTVAEYLGHSTAVVTELYSHLSPEHLNNEINKLKF